MRIRKLAAMSWLGALLFLSACGSRTAAAAESGAASAEAVQQEQDTEKEANQMKMKIGDTAVEVVWEDNESVQALEKLCETEPLTIQLSMYGGFEQVGALGSRLPRDDRQTTTQAGDIVLYSGDQIVVFYGSNSWAYTRLGKIANRTQEELAGLLGNGDTAITLYMGGNE